MWSICLLGRAHWKLETSCLIHHSLTFPPGFWPSPSSPTAQFFCILHGTLFSFVFLLGIFHIEIFHCLFLFGCHGSWAYPCILPLPNLFMSAQPRHLDLHTCSPSDSCSLELPLGHMPSGPLGAGTEKGANDCMIFGYCLFNSYILTGPDKIQTK